MPRKSRITRDARRDPGVDSRQSTILTWPHRPRRITERLALLAESNPTPEQYEREKARILGGQA